MRKRTVSWAEESLLPKHEGLSRDPQYPALTQCYGYERWGGVNMWVPEASWTTSLARWFSESRFQTEVEELLRKTSFHIHVHKHMYTCAYEHTKDMK